LNALRSIPPSAHGTGRARTADSTEEEPP
jgi:hypothetical protein